MIILDIIGALVIAALIGLGVRWAINNIRIRQDGEKQ